MPVMTVAEINGKLHLPGAVGTVQTLCGLPWENGEMAGSVKPASIDDACQECMDISKQIWLEKQEDKR